MAHSMAGECTPLKHAYDACFNAWFEGYLQPPVNPPSSASSQVRADYAKAKAEEYEQRCGKVWQEYKACIQRAVKDRGLDQMLAEATRDNPLDKPPPHDKPES